MIFGPLMLGPLMLGPLMLGPLMLWPTILGRRRLRRSCRGLGRPCLMRPGPMMAGPAMPRSMAPGAPTSPLDPMPSGYLALLHSRVLAMGMPASQLLRLTEFLTFGTVDRGG